MALASPSVEVKFYGKEEVPSFKTRCKLVEVENFQRSPGLVSPKAHTLFILV